MPGWKRTAVATGTSVQVSGGPITLHSITITSTLALGIESIFDSVGGGVKICDLKMQCMSAPISQVKTRTFILNWQMETALYVTNTLLGNIIVAWG